MPSTHDVTTCDSCGARIRWTVTANNKRLAVNADPDPNGNTAVHTDATGRVRSRQFTTERPKLEHLEWQAMPHVATCTNPRPRTPRTTPRHRYGVRPVRWQR